MIATITKALCLNYSKEYSSEHVQLLFQYAKKDIESKLMTWVLFIQAFKQAGKNCNFFPTYSKIIENLNTIKLKKKYDVIPESRQLNEKTYTMQEWLRKTKGDN